MIKKRKSLVVLAVLLSIVLLMASCGSKDESTSDSMSSEDRTEEKAYGGEQTTTVDTVEESSSENKDESYETQEPVVDFDDIAIETEGQVADDEITDLSLANRADSRKYIRTYRYYIETLEFDKTEKLLIQMVDMNFGFFQSEESSGRSLFESKQNLRQGSYVIRIPKEKIKEFTEGLEGIGNVIDSNSFVEDVTSQYFDVDARIRTLEIQEERLIAILEKADELEYIIVLERELADVRYEIEKYMTTFRNLEDRINYSTVHVELFEVYEETEVAVTPITYMDKMKNGFMNSVDDVIDFLGDLVLAITTNIPALILFVVILYAIYRIIKRLSKSKKSVVVKAPTVNAELNESSDSKDLKK